MSNARAEQVRQYCKENPTPEQDLCPEINQYIRTSKGYEMWNSKTLERKGINFDPTKWLNTKDILNVVSVRDEYEGLYIKYIEEFDALEFAHIFMEGNRGQNGEAKKWSYGMGWRCSRYIIFRGDSNAYSYSGMFLTGNSHYSKEFLKEMKEWSRRSYTGKENLDEFHKFDDTTDVCAMNPYCHSAVGQVWQYARWYQMCFIPRTTSKTFNDIASYEFENIDTTKVSENMVAGYFQILDDKYAVLRVFRYPDQWEVKHGADTNAATECARLFISAKSKPTLMDNESGVWKIKAGIPWRARGDMEILNKSELEKWNPVKYILSCLDMNELIVEDLINYLRHPIIEQIYKAGYQNIAKQMTYNGIPSSLRECFLVEKEKKLPMFKLLGVNKFAMAAAEKYGNLRIIREIKYYAGGFDATEVPEFICNAIADYIGDTHSWNAHSLTDFTGTDSYRWWRRKDRYNTPLTDDEREYIARLFKLEVKTPGIIPLYNDTLKIYKNLTHNPDINIYHLKDFEDVQRTHDALVELQVQEELEREAIRRSATENERMELLKKSFDKLQDKRIAKYEYEDEKFCIRVPHELSEITKEGICLHHCVKNYVDSHAQGGTNILFLRRKGAENVPFYTIEISNEGRVVQIHGSYNRWLGNNPEAIPFVYKYLTQLGASFDKELLLNKGSGYTAGDENLPESYLQAA